MYKLGIQFASSSIHRAKLKKLQCRYFWNVQQDKEKTQSCIEKRDPVPTPSQEPADKIPESWSQPKVVVVGAGIAGLSAALRLVQHGLCDVTVLEATDRPGGRIQSCWFTDSVAELGASSIRGACAANSVYNLAVQEHLLPSPATKESKNKGVFYSSRGQPIDVTVSYKAYPVFRHIESMARALSGHQLCEEDNNLQSLMASHIKREVMEFPEPERQGALMVMNTYLDSLREKFGSHLECVSTKYYGSLGMLPGGDVTIPVGFIGVLAPLIRNIPDCTIKYCKPVECIKWDVCEADKPRANVICAEGETYPADYVIVTTPLGFLKEKANTFFVPNLPSNKMEAISDLGFGHLNHLFLKFPEPMWMKDEGTMYFAWHPDDYSKSDSWVKGLTSLKIDEKNGQVLSGVVTGKEAVTLETMDADQIMQDVRNHMRCFLGNEDIPKPSSILRSMWSTNTYSRGAFTFISTDSDVSHIEDLADPTPRECEAETPVLLFAGEHTSLRHFATVHGARDSGIREADRVFNFTKLLKGAPSSQQN